MCRDVCQQDTTVTALWASVEVASPEGCRPCPVPIEHPSELDEHGRPRVLAVGSQAGPVGQEDIRVVCGGVFATLDCKRVELQGGSLFLIDPQSTKELGEGSISRFFSLQQSSPVCITRPFATCPTACPVPLML